MEAIVDLGAHANFVSPLVADQIDQESSRLANREVRAINNVVIVEKSDAVQSTTTLYMEGFEDQKFTAITAPITQHEVILRLPWLQKVNPNIQWDTMEVRPRLDPTSILKTPVLLEEDDDEDIALEINRVTLHSKDLDFLDNLYNAVDIGIEEEANEEAEFVLPEKFKEFAPMFSKQAA